jgi:hypothetical protein
LNAAPDAPVCWVPYAANGIAVGMFTAKSRTSTWVASGPFSGCHVSVGLTPDSKVYAAHIAQDGGSAPQILKDWETYKSKNKLHFLFEQKVKFNDDLIFDPRKNPAGMKNPAIYMFVEVNSSSKSVISVIRVDVEAKGNPGCGGHSGLIFKCGGALKG